MSLWRLVLCLTLLLPSLGFAQTPDEWTPYTPPAAETAPPPPLVPAPPAPQPPPPKQQPPPQPPPQRQPQPQAQQEPPEDEIIPRDLAAERARSGQSVLRLVVTPWAGAITGMMGVILGSIPTTIVALPFCVEARDFDEPQCAVAIGTGLSVSYSVGVTVGVMFVGRALGGEGDGVLTFLSALAGAAVGAGIGIATQSTGGLILGMAIGPLIGAASGYEISNTIYTQPVGPELQARRGFRWMPMIGTTPRGGILGGLAGRF